MAASTSKNTTKSPPRRRRRKKTAPVPRLKSVLLDIGIVALTFAVGVFAFSLAGRLGYSRAGGIPEPPKILRVQVLNGCGEAGAAARVADWLMRTAAHNWRFDVVDSDNFDRFNVDSTFVVNRALSPDDARGIVAALGLSTDRVIQGDNESNALSLDLTIVLGKSDYTDLRSTSDVRGDENR